MFVSLQIVLIVVAGVGFAFEQFLGLTLFQAITTFIQAPLKNVMTGLPGYLLIIFLSVINLRRKPTCLRVG